MGCQTADTSADSSLANITSGEASARDPSEPMPPAGEATHTQPSQPSHLSQPSQPSRPSENPQSESDSPEKFHSTLHRSISLRRLGLWASSAPHDGIIMGVAALVGLVSANAPWSGAYRALSSFTFGPEVLQLNLSVSTWATDGLLAIFFFVVALELKHEMAAGSLHSIRHAMVPALAAVGGMICPALIFIAVMLLTGQGDELHGWAIPTTTDIAFAMAVFTIFGRHQPAARRTFLLTLAVVDDLLGILVIALFYNRAISLWPLLAALSMTVVFALLARMRRVRWWLLLPVAISAWGLMHVSGIHATMTGVMLGITVPERLPHYESEHGGPPRTLRFADAVRPVSSGIALPVFAFFAAGVAIPWNTPGSSPFTQPVFYAVMLGLVIGKPLGVLTMTGMVTSYTPLLLPEGTRLRELIPVAVLSGIGFTISLLIAQLSYPDSSLINDAKLGVLFATLIATVIGGVMLHRADRGLDAQRS